MCDLDPSTKIHPHARAGEGRVSRRWPLTNFSPPCCGGGGGDVGEEGESIGLWREVAERFRSDEISGYFVKEEFGRED